MSGAGERGEGRNPPRAPTPKSKGTLVEPGDTCSARGTGAGRGPSAARGPAGARASSALRVEVAAAGAPDAAPARPRGSRRSPELRVARDRPPLEHVDRRPPGRQLRLLRQPPD